MNELKKQLHSCRETIIQRDATINENKNNHALAMQNLQHENGLLKQENENYERERIKIMKGKGLVDEENQSIKHKLQVLQREVDQLTIQRAKHLDTINDLKSRSKQDQEEKNNNEQNNRRLQVEINDIKNEKSQLDAKYNSILESNNDLKLRLENLKKVQDELRECRGEILGLKNRNNYLSTVEQELKDLQDDVHILKSFGSDIKSIAPVLLFTNKDLFQFLPPS